MSVRQKIDTPHLRDTSARHQEHLQARPGQLCLSGKRLTPHLWDTSARHQEYHQARPGQLCLSGKRMIPKNPVLISQTRKMIQSAETRP